MPITASAGFDDADYEQFQKQVLSRTGVRLIDYKSEQMRRRIAMMSQNAGCQSFMSLYKAMETNTKLLEEFLDKMTINVTELLRNPERFKELTEQILPGIVCLRGGPMASLAVWSAGCSYGAEAYTMAMLLLEMNTTATHRIKGTDIDLSVLARANVAAFSEADMNNISPQRRQKFFSDFGTGTFLPTMALRRMVQFGRHDLLSDAYPNAEYDLILCRNVLIYFTEEAKDRIYGGFFKALKPGGVLFVGGTERIPDHRAVGFELKMPFFYKKP
jgi:chemotaxis protein methyltransferase CheR